MRTFPQKFLFCFLLICTLLPAGARSQANALSFEKVWDQQIKAANFGGVQISDKYLFAGGEDGVLRAIDKLSGDLTWTYDAGAAISSNVTVDDKRVYFHSRAGVVHALDKESGSELWRFSTEGERQWDYWDYYLSTPAVDDRQVYFGSGDHHVYALDKRSGHLRWKVKTGNIVHGEPVISGEKVIVGGYDGRLYAIDRGTGRVLWKFKTVGNAYFRNGELPGAVSVADGIVYFGGRDYNIYALLEDTGTGAWNDMTPSWIIGQPLISDDDLFIVNSDGSMVYSYHRKTGKVNWEYQNSYNMFAGARGIGAEHIAVAGLDGRITILHRKDGSAATHYETDGSIAGRSEFFNEEGKLDYTGIRSIEDLMGLYDRQLRAMDGIAGNIVVEGNIIYYATVGGEVAAIRVNGIVLPEEEKP